MTTTFARCLLRFPSLHPVSMIFCPYNRESTPSIPTNVGDPPPSAGIVMEREPGEENVDAADGGGEVRVRPAADWRQNSTADPYSLLSGLECCLMCR
jgi:hypothetical protein